jgi:hypothetical protein
MPNTNKKSIFALFLISGLGLFLEVACIRWFGAHVQSLTFFTNVILMASFLGLSAGCLATRLRVSFIYYSPLVLAALMVLSLAMLRVSRLVSVSVSSAQYIFFGTHESGINHQLSVPMEVLGSLYFLLISLIFLGLGQELGRQFDRQTDRLQAYSFNILGSLMGLVCLTLCSWLELSPLVWFTAFGLGLAWYLASELPQNTSRVLRTSTWGALLLLPLLSMGGNLNLVFFHGGHSFFWSPYYRIGYSGEPDKSISVNHITHQNMVRTEDRYPAYSLPHLLNRDSGQAPFKEVLIIGAGSGNDVAHALAFGAQHVDAVEIDPVIQRLGAKDHPNAPYSDPRVTVHINDGRNFLSSTQKKYDLIVYALLDSLVLHSGYSNVRLESYLFTREALTQVKSHLKPTGTFAMYNYFRKGWLVSRLNQEISTVFSKAPVVLTFPNEVRLEPEKSYHGFTFLLAGETAPIEAALATHPTYRMAESHVRGAETPNGFTTAFSPNEKTFAFTRTEVGTPKEPLEAVTDNWPFLYLYGPMIPEMTAKGMLFMGLLALGVLGLILRTVAKQNGAIDSALPLRNLVTFFFLGAGFMLLEARSVVSMALLFGGTWLVNSVVFIAVLSLIFVGNLVVAQFKPRNPDVFFVGVLLALVVNWYVPMQTFLGLPTVPKVLFSCALSLAPLFFASLAFGVCFRDTLHPTLALGINIAGAILGGLSENFSLLIGFQNILIAAFACYTLAFIPQWLRAQSKSESKIRSNLQSPAEA